MAISPTHLVINGNEANDADWYRETFNIITGAEGIDKLSHDEG